MLRDSIRINVFLADLERLWHQYPDLRFFQLVRFIETEYNNDGFYVEDDKVLKTIQGLTQIAQLNNYKERAK